MPKTGVMLSLLPVFLFFALFLHNINNGCNRH